MREAHSRGSQNFSCWLQEARGAGTGSATEMKRRLLLTPTQTKQLLKLLSEAVPVGTAAEAIGLAPRAPSVAGCSALKKAGQMWNLPHSLPQYRAPERKEGSP